MQDHSLHARYRSSGVLSPVTTTSGSRDLDSPSKGLDGRRPSRNCCFCFSVGDKPSSHSLSASGICGTSAIPLDRYSEPSHWTKNAPAENGGTNLHWKGWSRRPLPLTGSNLRVEDMQQLKKFYGDSLFLKVPKRSK
jgi:hypothetical protein